MYHSQICSKTQVFVFSPPGWSCPHRNSFPSKKWRAQDTARSEPTFYQSCRIAGTFEPIPIQKWALEGAIPSFGGDPKDQSQPATLYVRDMMRRRRSLAIDRPRQELVMLHRATTQHGVTFTNTGWACLVSYGLVVPVLLEVECSEIRCAPHRRLCEFFVPCVSHGRIGVYIEVNV